MNILIITVGSRGDVQPFVALGKGLKAAGNTVTICTCSKFEPFITRYGLGYSHMTDELLKLMETDAGRKAIEDTLGVWGAIKTMIKMIKLTKPINRRMILDSWEAARAAQPDLIVFHFKAIGAVSIAEKLQIPAVMASLQPMMVPTAAFPMPGTPDLGIGGWYNRLSYRLVQLGYKSYRKMIDEFRVNELGLKKFPGNAGIRKTARGHVIPVLHGFSPHVVPRPEDWPQQARVCGYWFLDQQREQQPSTDLEAFIDNGDPPVYVGFGSMAGRNPKRLAGIVIRALQKANLRGIIATGWGGLEAGALPDTILRIDSAPHEWLFPRVSAVIHHGGAGTTAAGLRAGKPTIICPFMGDQPFWGKRVYELGVGPLPIRQKRLSVENLVRALLTITGDDAMAVRAAALGKHIRDEDGTANAIASIEEITPQNANH